MSPKVDPSPPSPPLAAVPPIPQEQNPLTHLAQNVLFNVHVQENYDGSSHSEDNLEQLRQEERLLQNQVLKGVAATKPFPSEEDVVEKLSDSFTPLAVSEEEPQSPLISSFFLAVEAKPSPKPSDHPKSKDPKPEPLEGRLKADTPPQIVNFIEKIFSELSGLTKDSNLHARLNEVITTSPVLAWWIRHSNVDGRADFYRALSKHLLASPLEQLMGRMLKGRWADFEGGIRKTLPNTPLTVDILVGIGAKFYFENGDRAQFNFDWHNAIADLDESVQKTLTRHQNALADYPQNLHAVNFGRMMTMIGSGTTIVITSIEKYLLDSTKYCETPEEDIPFKDVAQKNQKLEALPSIRKYKKGVGKTIQDAIHRACKIIEGTISEEYLKHVSDHLLNELPPIQTMEEEKLLKARGPEFLGTLCHFLFDRLERLAVTQVMPIMARLLVKDPSEVIGHLANIAERHLKCYFSAREGTKSIGTHDLLEAMFHAGKRSEGKLHSHVPATTLTAYIQDSDFDYFEHQVLPKLHRLLGGRPEWKLLGDALPEIRDEVTKLTERSASFGLFTTFIHAGASKVLDKKLIKEIIKHLNAKTSPETINNKLLDLLSKKFEDKKEDDPFAQKRWQRFQQECCSEGLNAPDKHYEKAHRLLGYFIEVFIPSPSKALFGFHGFLISTASEVLFMLQHPQITKSFIYTLIDALLDEVSYPPNIQNVGVILQQEKPVKPEQEVPPLTDECMTSISRCLLTIARRSNSLRGQGVASTLYDQVTGWFQKTIGQKIASSLSKQFTPGVRLSSIEVAERMLSKASEQLLDEPKWIKWVKDHLPFKG